MRVAVASRFGNGLSWWRRLADEGADVRVWIDPPSQKSVGDGLIEKAGAYETLLSWAKEGVLSGEPTLMLFDSISLGQRADAARRWGLPVVGGGAFMDRLEKDRAFGARIAAEAGTRIPPCEEFASIHDALSRCESAPLGPAYFKSDRYIDGDATHGAHDGEEMAQYLRDLIEQHGGHGRCVLQTRIEGVPFSTGRWWNGLAWVGPYEATYENKRLMNDDVGPSTGCALNAIWFYPDEDPYMAQALGWEGLTLPFRRAHAPPGLYDLNAIVDAQGDAWFLEFTSRLGYDSEPTSQRLIPNLSAHLFAVANGAQIEAPYDDLAYAVRLSIPPYPWEYGERSDEGSADGHRIGGADGIWDGNFIAYDVRMRDEALVSAGPEGIVGLTLAVGERLSDLHAEAMAFAKSLSVAGLMYRTDGDRDCAQAAKRLAEAGVEVHPGLLAQPRKQKTEEVA